MEIGQGNTPPPPAAPAPAEQPRRVDDQATRRAVARSDDAEAQREKHEREATERRASQGGVDVRA